jgi:hypothetical protein
MSRFLITFGAVLLILGLFWPVFQKFGLGRLPGDIVIECETFRVFIPITTSPMVGIALSLILWFLNR